MYPEVVMKDLIQKIAESLVDSPEQVAVTEKKSHHTSVFELSVAKGDVGKVIGKKGRTAVAMRTILNAVSAKENKRAILEIID
jgi:predicted RNA-binding protein YlqC (UPF0109 family)